MINISSMQNIELKTKFKINLYRIRFKACDHIFIIKLTL